MVLTINGHFRNLNWSYRPYMVGTSILGSWISLWHKYSRHTKTIKDQWHEVYWSLLYPLNLGGPMAFFAGSLSGSEIYFGVRHLNIPKTLMFNAVKITVTICIYMLCGPKWYQWEVLVYLILAHISPFLGSWPGRAINQRNHSASDAVMMFVWFPGDVINRNTQQFSYFGKSASYFTRQRLKYVKYHVVVSNVSSYSEIKQLNRLNPSDRGLFGAPHTPRCLWKSESVAPGRALLRSHGGHRSARAKSGEHLGVSEESNLVVWFQ